MSPNPYRNVSADIRFRDHQLFMTDACEREMRTEVDELLLDTIGKSTGIPEMESWLFDMYAVNSLQMNGWL